MGFSRAYPDKWSHHEVYQYSQMFCAKNFQSFDYSQFPEELRRDFSVKTYNMSKVTAPTLILEASMDFCSQPKDYQRIRGQLTNLIGKTFFRICFSVPQIN